MNWVDFKGLTFNLDKVTHFETYGSDELYEIRAYLNVSYPAQREQSVDIGQVYISIGHGRKQECQKWITEIVAGEYSLPDKHLYSIQKHLNKIDETLGKIACSIENFSQKQ